MTPRRTFVLLVSLLLSLAAFAADKVSYRGRVLDASGAAIAGAHIVASPDGDVGAAAASADSDKEGRFTLQLEPGAYVLHIGDRRYAEIAEPVTIAADGGQRDFTLQVAAVTEAITVKAPSPYIAPVVSSATKTPTPLRDVPQSVTVVTKELIADQMMTSIGDVVRYVPGVALHQGENNRDQVIIRGNSSSADFFVDGVRDDVQYYRDLYNLDRVEALKGPNAMVFGRGGGGGVINRVTKEAGFDEKREVMVQGGAYSDRRVTADFDQPITDNLAFRLNGMYESSNSFRDGVDLRRDGIAPSLTYRPSEDTKVTFGYEHFRDTRAADRGITSFQGRPANVDVDTFYGNPDDSHVRAKVDLATAVIQHRMGALTVRNRTLFGDYDRFYQNYVPGAVTANGAQVTITAYNNDTQRQNLFNQTDFIYGLNAGGMKHTLLGGIELGQQLTDNFRNTGFFNNTATSILAPFGSPTIATPVTYRQSATDANNHLKTNVSAVYAQDQIELSPRIQILAGVRFDRFDLTYHNNRNGDEIGRVDKLVSPRAGVVFKPLPALSVYGSYGVSYLPSSGDQFSSLTKITEQVEPEKFSNYEIGAKWDATNALQITTATYLLDRTNTRSTDPNDPTRIVQTGSQRTNGYELGVNGQITPAWSIAGGFAYQDAYVTSATTAARTGAQVAQVPHHTFSLWNNYDFTARTGAAVGAIYRSKMFATIDNSVTLPGYTRFDVAAYYNLSQSLRLQLNVENVFDKKYWANADSNTNISPGSPRAARLGFMARF
ncbi:MAG: TonB-dependent siderophore receptor [Acidobacteria bacterium]|nr:TonB-dependent siderophore receptor [Acidobacteriota bacterium]